MQKYNITKEMVKFTHQRNMNDDGSFVQYGGITIGWTFLEYDHQEYIAIGVAKCHKDDRFVKSLATDMVVERINQTVNAETREEASSYVWILPKHEFDIFVVENHVKYFASISINANSIEHLMKYVESTPLSDFTYIAMRDFAETVVYE